MLMLYFYIVIETSFQMVNISTVILRSVGTVCVSFIFVKISLLQHVQNTHLSKLKKQERFHQQAQARLFSSRSFTQLSRRQTLPMIQGKQGNQARCSPQALKNNTLQMSKWPCYITANRCPLLIGDRRT